VAERLYGENKLSYGVTERRNGWIELRVYHSNRSMRQVLQDHIGDTSYFLRRYHAYSRSGTRAESWLAKVIAEYRSRFQRNLVKIVLSPSTLAPAMAAPPADVLPDDSPEKRSLSMRTPGLRGQVTPEEACRVIHEALESLPLLASPADVPFGVPWRGAPEEGQPRRPLPLASSREGPLGEAGREDVPSLQANRGDGKRPPSRTFQVPLCESAGSGRAKRIGSSSYRDARSMQCMSSVALLAWVTRV
jgi:hypothetical protein